MEMVNTGGNFRQRLYGIGWLILKLSKSRRYYQLLIKTGKPHLDLNVVV